MESDDDLGTTVVHQSEPGQGLGACSDRWMMQGLTWHHVT